MKNVTIILLLLFTTSFVFGQLLDYENQVIRDYKKERNSENQQNKIIGDISGLCDAISFATNQEAGIGWDNCISSYEGIIEFEAVDGSNYNVYSTNATGMKLNDMSFGTYHDCYDVETQESMPNNNASAPTLFFNVDDEGTLSFTGSSQWGEFYSLTFIGMDGPVLNLFWRNDYGEGGQVELSRQDGQFWEDLLDNPCPICSESDSLALVAIYNSTDGPNWNIPWDLSTPVREWYGVTLNSSCCVAEIDLGPSQVNEGFEAKIYLLDIQGKVVMDRLQKVKNGSNVIDLDNRDLTKGFYILKIASKDKVASKRIIIQ